MTLTQQAIVSSKLGILGSTRTLAKMEQDRTERQRDTELPYHDGPI